MNTREKLALNEQLEKKNEEHEREWRKDMEKQYSIPRSEQETTIRWDAEEQTAHIYAANPSTINKLDKLCEEYPEAYKCVWVDRNYPAKRYEVPAQYIRFGHPASEAVKEASRKKAENLRKYRENSRE